MTSTGAWASFGLALAGAIAAAVSGASSSSSSSSSSTRPPPPTHLGSLPGWRLATDVTPAVTAFASSVLRSGLAYGETLVRTIDGRQYLARVEPHYDDHAGGGVRWHRGVTVYEKATG